MKLNAQERYDQLRQSLDKWRGNKRQGLIPVDPEGWECDQTLIVEKRAGLEGPTGCAHNTAKHSIVPADGFGVDYRKTTPDLPQNTTNHPFLISTEQGDTANHPEAREFRNLALDCQYRTSGLDIGGAHSNTVRNIGIFNAAHVALRLQESSRVTVESGWIEGRNDNEWQTRGYGVYGYKAKGDVTLGKIQLHETAFCADRCKEMRLRADVEHCPVALDARQAQDLEFRLYVQTCGEVPLSFQGCGEGVEGVITIRKPGGPTQGGQKFAEVGFVDLDGNIRRLTTFRNWNERVKLRLWSGRKFLRGIITGERKIKIERMR